MKLSQKCPCYNGKAHATSTANPLLEAASLSRPAAAAALGTTTAWPTGPFCFPLPLPHPIQDPSQVQAPLTPHAKCGIACSYNSKQPGGGGWIGCRRGWRNRPDHSFNLHAGEAEGAVSFHSHHQPVCAGGCGYSIPQPHPHGTPSAGIQPEPALHCRLQYQSALPELLSQSSPHSSVFSIC